MYLYSCGAFEANVEDGTEPRTRQLRFDVTGEGTLPCVTVEQPTAVDTDGSLMIDPSNGEEPHATHVLILYFNVVNPQSDNF